MADLLETIRAVSKTSAFNQWLDLEVISAEPGAVEIRLAWRPEFVQYNGFLHASLVGGLIDTASRATCSPLISPSNAASSSRWRRASIAIASAPAGQRN